MMRPLLLFLSFSLYLCFSPVYSSDQLNDHQLDVLLEHLLDQREVDGTFLRNNIHLIDQNQETGFALYRTSRPTESDMKMFCELGIQEMLVLSGTAERREWRYQQACPDLKVVDNIEQVTRVPVDEDFLEFFDQWVQEAQEQGRVIAFRCECGCHRTGRLAAYYQMKYQGISLREARRILTRKGYFMWLFPHIYPQVDALYDFINQVPCSTRERYCVGANR